MINLTKKERLRRVALLCCHFSRNLAYYRAWHARLAPGEYGEILATIDGNFIDMAVLEWCKLFGDRRGKHYWKKAVYYEGFEAKMLEHCDVTADQFKEYVDELREYRDKFLAHLDDERIMNIPRMDLANKTVTFLFVWLVSEEASIGDLTGLPIDLTIYHDRCYSRATSFLDRCSS